MALFCLKRINKTLSAGDKLKQARQERGLKLFEAARLTKISKEYLQAIESLKPKKLPPAKVHVVAYVRKYADTLGLPATEIVQQFMTETGLAETDLAHPQRHLKIKPLQSVGVWLKRLATASLALAFAAYLIWQVNGILQPPKLVIYTPTDGYVSSSLTTLVQGETDKEVTLSINGREIRPNEQGRFEAAIDLSQGLNKVTISAIKKHGKSTTLTRHVIVREAEGDQLSFKN